MPSKRKRTQFPQVVNPDCDGIDIGKDRHFVAVGIGSFGGHKSADAVLRYGTANRKACRPQRQHNSAPGIGATRSSVRRRAREAAATRLAPMFCTTQASGNVVSVSPLPNDCRQCSTGFSMASKAS